VVLRNSSPIGPNLLTMTYQRTSRMAPWALGCLSVVSASACRDYTCSDTATCLIERTDAGTTYTDNSSGNTDRSDAGDALSTEESSASSAPGTNPATTSSDTVEGTNSASGSESTSDTGEVGVADSSSGSETSGEPLSTDDSGLATELATPEPCPIGSYDDDTDPLTVCVAWSDCGWSTVVEPGTSTTDVACSAEELVMQFALGDYSGVVALLTDESRNTYAVVDSSPNGSDFMPYVKKLDAAGQELWTLPATERSTKVAGAAMNPDGTYVLVGTLRAVDDVGDEIWIAKYSTAGTLLWEHTYGTQAHDEGLGIAIDSAGNAVVVGSAWGLEPPAWTATKFNASGDVLWHQQHEISEGDLSTISVDTDHSGGFVTARSEQGFFGGSGSSRKLDVFVRKIDSEGASQWERQFGSSEDDIVNDVAVDTSGNIVAVGSTLGVLGSANLGLSDAWVRAYSPSGEVLWTQQFGSSADDFPYSVTLRHSGGFLVVGSTSGEVGQEVLGQADGFLAVLGPSGAVQFTKQLGSPEAEYLASSALIGDHRALVAGSSRGSWGGTQMSVVDAVIAQVVIP
jgi:hypothetical protein